MDNPYLCKARNNRSAAITVLKRRGRIATRRPGRRFPRVGRILQGLLTANAA